MCARSEIECVQHYTFGCANFTPIKGSLYSPVPSPSDALDHQVHDYHRLAIHSLDALHGQSLSCAVRTAD